MTVVGRGHTWDLEPTGNWEWTNLQQEKNNHVICWLACVAGGIVSVREIRLWQASGEAAKPRGEWGEGLWNTACKKTIGFWMVRTPACGKNGLVERSTHVNQMLDDCSNISRGTLCFTYENKSNAWQLVWTKPNNGIYNTQHNQQTIHLTPETYAQSDSCKKCKNFSRQAYSFPEEKLQHLRRKTYEGKYDT